MVADHRYSSLHQERSYLLSALAREESRAEHMNGTLETIRAKLQMAQADQGSAEAIGNLKKAVMAISRKLKKCYKSERAMANNLAAVTARMQILEQHQWRKAQSEYSQRMQQMPISGVALGLQEMTLESRMSPAYGYPCTPYPPTPYTIDPLSATLPSMPATPFLQPQSTMNMEMGWNTPLPMPHYNQFQPPFGMYAPFNTPQPSMPTSWQNMDIQYSPYAVSNEPIKASRRMSLPNPPRRTSWGGIEFLGRVVEDPANNESVGPGSMVGDTTVSHRMQEM